MSGSGAAERQRITAMQAARLAKEGHTHRQIAQILNRKPEQIKTLIQLGERIASTKERGR